MMLRYKVLKRALQELMIPDQHTPPSSKQLRGGVKCHEGECGMTESALDKSPLLTILQNI
jgi:hypothetical protein